MLVAGMQADLPVLKRDHVDPTFSNSAPSFHLLTVRRPPFSPFNCIAVWDTETIVINNCTLGKDTQTSTSQETLPLR